MANFNKTYTNGEVTVSWKPEMCIHSTKCFQSLPEVFNPNERPWIKPENSTTDKIVETVQNCPSGALSYKYNDAAKSGENKNAEVKPVQEPLVNSPVRIQVNPNGPFTVSGKCIIIDKDGNETVKEGKFSLCRCGKSARKPFCDGTHKTITFDS